MSLPSREGSPRPLEAQATIGSTSPGSRLLGQVLLPLSPQNGAAALLGAPPHAHFCSTHTLPDPTITLTLSNKISEMKNDSFSELSP